MKAHYLLGLILTTLFISPTWANDPLTPQPAPNIQLQSQAVKVYTLPDGRFHAEINYQDQANATRKFTFEGSKEEIRQQLTQSGLPEDRQQAVLQALDMRPGALFGNGFGNGFPFGPSLFDGKDPFDHPFFKQNPFNDPFFQNDPFDDEFFQKFWQDLPSLGNLPELKPFVPQPQPQEITPPAPVKPVVPDATGNRVWL